MQNSQISQDYHYIFHILQCFATKLHNFAKFRMLFPAVLINIPNFKVCLKGESSIAKEKINNNDNECNFKKNNENEVETGIAELSLRARYASGHF